MCSKLITPATSTSKDASPEEMIRLKGELEVVKQVECCYMTASHNLHSVSIYIHIVAIYMLNMSRKCVCVCVVARALLWYYVDCCVARCICVGVGCHLLLSIVSRNMLRPFGIQNLSAIQFVYVSRFSLSERSRYTIHASPHVGQMARVDKRSQCVCVSLYV